MPRAMEAMPPEMLSEVMSSTMPPMLPQVATLIVPKMTAYLWRGVHRGGIMVTGSSYAFLEQSCTSRYPRSGCRRI